MQPLDLAYIFTSALSSAIVLHTFGIVSMLAWACLMSVIIYVLHR